MTDARLQALYQEALGARAAAAADACPAPERLQALVAREGSEEERLATLDHALQCRTCARELELLRAVRVASPAARRPFAPRRWLVAASALIAVIAGTLVYRADTAPNRLMRGARGANGVTLVAPGASDSVLRWHAVPGAVTYLVEVMDAQGGLVTAGKTSDTTFALPDDVRPAAGSREQWWVRARLGNGTELHSAVVPLGPPR